MKIFTNDQIRTIERTVIENDGISSIELVERAAQAVTWEIMSRWRPSKPVIVFAGHGNNGADALAVARMLIDEGYTVETFLFNIFNHLSEAAAHFRDLLVQQSPSSLTEVTGDFTPPYISPDSIVIDGLFGSGLNETLTGGFQSLVDYINNSNATIVSIDIPSGMFAEWNDRNLSRNVIHASLTLAIEFPRVAFFIEDNAEFLGEWKVLDIKMAGNEVRSVGSPYYLLEQSDAARLLNPRGTFVSKADLGNILLVAGRYGMMGAAQLCGRGALRSGIGKLTIHSPRCGYHCLQTALPEAMFQADHEDLIVTDINVKHDYSAIAVGPGLGTHEYTVRAMEKFINSMEKPIIIDADAINCIANRLTLLDHIPAMSVLTPHAGEFDRLFGEHHSHESRLKTAIDRAAYYNLIILLKGHYTSVVRPDGKIYFIDSGTPALATPGSGDVLTGIIASLAGQGFMTDVAAALGAFIHGRAGCMAQEQHGEYGVMASDIADCTGKAIKEIMSQR